MNIKCNVHVKKRICSLTFLVVRIIWSWQTVSTEALAKIKVALVVL